MNFEFTPEQLRAAEELSRVLEARVTPGAASLDDATPAERDTAIRRNLKTLGEAGYLGLAYSSGAGGGGKTLVEWTLQAEAVARACSSTFLAASASIQGAAMPLCKYGTPQQQKRYLAPALCGDAIGALALSEAQGGSDEADIRTRAEDTPDGYTLEGAKSFVTNGPYADFFVLTARVGDGTGLFVVPGDAPGLVRRERLELMGNRGAGVCDVELRAVRVSRDALIGDAGSGARYAAEALLRTRMAAALGCVGIAQNALALSLDRARGRIVGGQKLIRNQEISFKLAQMRLGIDTSRLAVEYAAWCVENGTENAADAVASAKIHAAESAAKAATWAVQIFGGQGYVHGSPVERLYRDARLGEIIWGPSETQRMAIARSILTQAGG